MTTVTALVAVQGVGAAGGVVALVGRVREIIVPPS